MADKEARGARRNSFNWRMWLPFLFGAALLGVTCLAVRQFWGPGRASAQAPRAAGAQGRGSQGGRQGKVPPAGQKPSGPIAVLAIVNNQQISREYIAQQALLRYGKEVLEVSVNRQLIGEACQRQGVTVTEQEVDDEIARLAKKFGLTTDAYLSLLENERNISPKQYGRDVVWPMLAMRKLAADRIRVGPDEIREAFETEIGPRVKVRMIVSGTREKADWIRQQALAAPEKFGVLAKDHSEDETTASGRGWIPPIRLHVGNPELERVAFSLKQGEISPVLEIDGRFLVIKCEEHMKGTPPDALSPQQRELFTQKIVEHLRDRKMREVAQSMFQDLQNHAKIKNVFNDAQLRQQMPDVAAIINGQKVMLGDLAEDCIARHGIEVLDGEINRLLLMQELKRKSQSVSQQDIDQEVARAAESYGFTVKEWLKKVEEEDGATLDVYLRDAVWPTVALKKLVAGRVRVTEEDMQKGYEANYGPRMEIMAIVLSNHRQAQQVWEMARNNPTDQFFGELAHQYSIEPISRANYGRVPPIARYAGQPLLEKEAFKLHPPTGNKPGELSGLIAVDDKFIILRCIGMTKPVEVKYEEVRDELYKDILEKKLRLEMAKEFDRLKETAQVDNFLAGTSQSGKPAGPARGQPAPEGRISGRLPFGTAPRR